MDTNIKISEGNLEILKGARLRLWHFSPSHNRLVYEIVAHDKWIGKYLIFVGCTLINTPVFCGVTNPQLIRLATDEYKFIEPDSLDIQFLECVVRDDFRPEEISAK
jgi:hypothetical protein